jgi:hypothetical protein
LRFLTPVRQVHLKEIPMLKLVAPPFRSSTASVARVLGFIALAVIAILVPLVALAQAAPVPPNPDDLGALLNLLFQAVSLSGPARWFAFLFVGVMLGVYVLRKLGGRLSPGIAAFVRSDEGGTLLNLIVSAAGALLTKAFVGDAMTWPVVGAAFVAAAGGTGTLWSMGRRLLRLFVPLVEAVPRVGAPLAALLRFVSGGDVKAKVAAEADAAYKPLPDTTSATQADAILFPKA